MVTELLYEDDLSEVWHADALDQADVNLVMGGRVADALIFDGPFSEKTHQGHADGKMTSDSAASFAARHAGAPTRESRYAARKSAAGESGRRDIDYSAWQPDDVDKFCSLWHPVCSGWRVSITDSELANSWSLCFEAGGCYSFAPLPLVETGSRVRMTGDGPSNWTCWLVVARPRHEPYSKWGTLPGAYIQPGEREINTHGGTDRIVGGKPLQAMIRIVGDYSRRGDLVVDPTCGAGTTLVAAKMSGRRSIGMDVSRERAEIAVKRLRRAHEQGHLFEQVGT